MILRRFMQHVKEQNWFAVGLDVIVVIVGIFLGMQVNEWNEERLARIEEKTYLKRIQEDIIQSIERTESSIEYMVSHANKASVILKSLDRCNIASEDEEDFATGLYQLGKVTPAFLLNFTIDELRSTGKWHIISDVEIRTKISAMAATHKSTVSIFSQVEGRLLPHINYVESVVSYEITKPIGGSASMSLADLRYDLEKLCGDNHFYNAVSNVRNYVFDLVTQNRRVVRAYITTLDDLNPERNSE